jgi:nucleoside-diphosphate-sugar epimerase
MLIDLARRSGAGTTIGDGQNIWSAVHIDDLAEAYRSALLKPGGGLYNIASEEAVTMHEIAGGIGRMLGHVGGVKQWPLDEARAAIGMLADGLHRTSASPPPRHVRCSDGALQVLASSPNRDWLLCGSEGDCSCRRLILQSRSRR